MASGPSIEKRWGKVGSELYTNKKVWEIESYYLAQAIANYILILSPKKVILGGGVMNQELLFPLIRKEVVNLLNGYIQANEILEDIDSYIVLPGLGDNAGLAGAVALAQNSLIETKLL